MITAEKSVMPIECERHRWFVALAFGRVDEAVAVLPAQPAPVDSDVLP
jgi:hypothetical protein